MKNGWAERAVFLVAIVALTGMLINEGRTQVQLERKVPVSAKALYDQMAAGQMLQLIDIRPLSDEDDDIGGYEEARVPKSIPFPGCDAEQTPEEALKHIKFAAPTIIISNDGSMGALEKCGMFNRVRLLEGGMVAWDDAAFPEDEGEYVPPKAGGSGGGCL